MAPQRPAWLTKRTLKTFFRTTVVFLGTLILIINTKASTAMGSASFFAGILCCILPPYMPVSLLFLAMSTLCIGMLLGWAVGAAAMAAANAARSPAILQAGYATLQAQIQADPSLTASTVIFRGVFLDPRSSTVYGVLLFFGAFAFGAAKGHAPKLALLSTFALIVLDICCMYGPFLPTPQYTLAETFLKPTATYFGMVIAATIFIFPQTMSHFWLSDVVDKVLEPSKQLLALQSEIVSLPVPLEAAAVSEKLAKARGIRKLMIAGIQGVMGNTGFLQLEVTRGKLGPADLKSVQAFLLKLAGQTSSLMSFATMLEDVLALDTVLDDSSAALTEKPSNTASDSTTGFKEKEKAKAPQTTKAALSSYNARFLNLRKRNRERERQNQHDLSSLLPLLSETSAPLREASSSALSSATAWLDSTNHSRWKVASKGSAEKEAAELAEMKTTREALSTALAAFRRTERNRLVEGPFGPFFQAGGKPGDDEAKRLEKETGFSAGSLFLCFVFATTLEFYAETLDEFLVHLCELRAKRPANRVWWPSGFGSIARKIKARKSSNARNIIGGNDVSEGNVFGGGLEVPVDRPKPGRRRKGDHEDADDEDDEEAGLLSTAHDPDASVAKTGGQRFAVKFSNFARWFSSHEGLYALRMGIVSVVVFTIQVHPTTAAFTYENRGLWAAIMAQMGVAVYAGDQIAQFVLRMVGTLAGLVVGMIVWYVGAQKGLGNPYGVAAASCVFILPFIFARIILPPAQMLPFLMTAVTAIFVVGYSWLDGHTVQTINSGIGAELAYKRALLVMVGFVIAFLVMCVPKVSSARVVVRKTASNLIEECGMLYASETEAFLLEEARQRRGEVGDSAADKERKEKRTKRLTDSLIQTFGAMEAIAPSRMTAKFEPQLKGPWPSATYEQIYANIDKLLFSLNLLSRMLRALDAKWCSILVHQTPFFNADLITDVFTAISLISQSLYHGHPLPPTMCSLRDRLVYHSRHLVTGYAPAQASRSATDELDSGADKIDGASIGLRGVTLDHLLDPSFPVHSTAVMALASILRSFDEITELVESLVGSSATFRHIEEWRGDLLGAEEDGRLRSFMRGDKAQ